MDNTETAIVFIGPNWDNAPKGAMVCAQDENGEVHFYENEPFLATKTWHQISGESWFLGEFAPPKDFKSAIWRKP